MSDARSALYVDGKEQFTPDAHAPTHENGGTDEISVAGLSGELADAQPPKAHDLVDTTGHPVTGLTVGHVLTATGATTYAFQAAAGGGGASPFDCTIGSAGADYTSWSAAIADGKIRPLQITDVTETANTTWIAPGFSGYIPSGIKLTMAGNWFTGTVADPIDMEGGGEIDWTNTVGAALFTHAGAFSPKVSLSNLTLTNNSTNGFLTSSCIEEIRDCTAEVTVTGKTGHMFRGEPGSSYIGVTAIGLNSVDIFQLLDPPNGAYVMDNVRFEGTYSGNVIQVENPGVLTNIVYAGTSTGVTFRLEDVVFINNLYVEGTGDLDINIVQAAGVAPFVMSNFDLNGGDFRMNGADFAKISNGDGIGSLILTTATALNCVFNALRITNACTVAGDRHKFDTCEFLGGAQDNGENNGWNNCQFGPDGGGGALTLTLGAAAVSPRVSMCMSDAVIIDSGATTPAVDPVTNTVY